MSHTECSYQPHTHRDAALYDIFSSILVTKRADHFFSRSQRYLKAAITAGELLLENAQLCPECLMGHQEEKNVTFNCLSCSLLSL